MSKTFKSAVSERELEIGRAYELVRFNITSADGERLGIETSREDAAAQALAILEAAGFEDSSTGGHITGARIAVGDLKRHVKMQERATAEAEAQAKLEAEALELRNAYHKGIGYSSKDWSHLNDEQKEVWLAVARRAREINKEEK